MADTPTGPQDDGLGGLKPTRFHWRTDQPIDQDQADAIDQAVARTAELLLDAPAEVRLSLGMGAAMHLLGAVVANDALRIIGILEALKFQIMRDPNVTAAFGPAPPGAEEADSG